MRYCPWLCVQCRVEFSPAGVRVGQQTVLTTLCEKCREIARQSPDTWRTRYGLGA